MAGALEKQGVAASSRTASLVSERGSSPARSEKLGLVRVVDPRSATWDDALAIASLPSRDVRRSDFIEEVGRQLGIDEIQGELVQVDYRLTAMDRKLDRLEEKLDTLFDEVTKMLQGLPASSRVEEAAAEDIEEEVAVEEEEEDEIATTDEVEKEEDEEAAAAIEEEEEIEEEEKKVAEEAVAEEEMIASEDEEEVAAGNKEVVKEGIDEAHLVILIPDTYFDPFLPRCNKQGSKNANNLLLVAFLQLSGYCSPGVCTNALKRLGLQFAVEMGMIMVVGDDEMPMPLLRPPPEPPPEPPPRT